MRRERPVEPVPLRAAGESEPFSQEFPALSPEVETISAARYACKADGTSGHGESVVSPKADLIRTVTMSNTPLKCIVLIIRRIYFDNLLD